MVVNQVEVRQQASTSATFSGEELALVAALRNGEDCAFAMLLDRYHSAMVRLASIYVSNRMIAEEVAQEAWLGVIEGIQRFEGRSSLKTWILRILTNCAKKRAQREGRSVPFSALFDSQAEPDEPSVEPTRFFPSNHPQSPGRWTSFPRSWGEIPEERLLSQEVRAVLEKAIRGLPPHQREVITLRDIEGLTSAEVCNVLGIGETNQRVLLHRARSGARRALEQYLREDST